MTDERFKGLAAGSLLGELEGAEAAEFEAELARRGSPGEAIVRELREVLGSLALAAPPLAPPVGLWERIRAAIGAAPSGAEPAAAVTPLRRPPVWPWAAAAALAAAVALWLAATNARLRDANHGLEADLAAAEERLVAADSARQRLADLRADLEVLAGPASSVHSLTGTGELLAARARVFLDPATGRAILFAYDLPLLPPDTVYELWAISSGTPRAAGIFRADPDGRARLEVDDAAILQDLEALAVTIEPAPGTQQPTSEPVLISSS